MAAGSDHAGRAMGRIDVEVRRRIAEQSPTLSCRSREQEAGEAPSERGLADPGRTADKPGVVQAVAVHGVDEGARDIGFILFAQIGLMIFYQREHRSLQSRKAELNGLIKRFGKSDDKNDSLNQVILESNSALEMIADLTGGDNRIEEIRAELEKSFHKLQKSASILTKKRNDSALELGQEITKQLADLSLPNAIFEISVKSASSDSFKNYLSSGLDSIVFNFASHKSAKVAPLSKSASGGELSRVMLAIEVVLAKNASIGTYIFDEVDAGVGGKAAIEVGRKLTSVAKTSQVIVVSHLAQVAVWAQNHLVVEKSDQGDFIESSVSTVADERRKVEVARLLSGQEGSDSAREHAAELLELAGD